MNDDKQDLISQIRYAQRLCERTARLYQHMQALCTFASVLGGSAALTALSSMFPGAIGVSGAAVFAFFGALNLAVRPAEKIAANRQDVRKYGELLAHAHGMGTGDLQKELNRLHMSDADEVESLRDVAWLDVVHETGADPGGFKLSPWQRLLAAVA